MLAHMRYAATHKALVFAFRFPFPGLGRVVPKGEARHWQPIDAAKPGTWSARANRTY
jgi:hypothetical protein